MTKLTDELLESYRIKLLEMYDTGANDAKQIIISSLEAVIKIADVKEMKIADVIEMIEMMNFSDNNTTGEE